MSWILLLGAIVCGWAMLRTMGGERERRVQEQRQIAAALAAPALPAPQTATKPPSWAVSKQAPKSPPKPPRKQAA